MKRYAMVGRLSEEGYASYKALHKEVGPKILETIKKANIQNYSIHHHDGLLYSYFEYTGVDFDSDMAKMAADPDTQKWWTTLRPSLETWGPREDGEWWRDCEELFHLD